MSKMQARHIHNVEIKSILKGAKKQSANLRKIPDHTPLKIYAEQTQNTKHARKHKNAQMHTK